MWVEPVDSGFVTSGWGDRRYYKDSVSGKQHEHIHQGLDFRGPVGAPIYAAACGKVHHVRKHITSSAGHWIAILHENGWFSRYLHLDSWAVEAGDQVTAGQMIGTMGRSGVASAKTHLHFDIKVPKNLIEDYRSQFGTPSGGFQGPKGYGYGVPAEPLIPVTQYTDTVVQRAAKRGLTLNHNVPKSGGTGAVSAILMAGIGFAAWKILG